LAAGAWDQPPTCGLYSATSASAMIDEACTLGLKRPKYRGCVTCRIPVSIHRAVSLTIASSERAPAKE
jgi:hypothetical protein